MPVRRVAVVGAGVVGAAVADALVAAGAEVTVIEAGAPGGGTSATSLAWLNSNQKAPRDYHDFSVRAMGEWRRLAARFAQPDWYRPTGSLAWAQTDGQRAELTARIGRLRDWSYPVQEPGAERLRELEPRLRIPTGAQAAFFPAEGHVHTREAVGALIERAAAGGARLVPAAGPAVLRPRGSRVAAVALPDGQLISADAYVCCAGWRTPALLEPLGVPVPLVPGDLAGSAAPGVVADVATGRALLERVVHTPDLSLRPAASGGLRMDAEDVNGRVDRYTPQRELDRHAAELVARAARVLPELSASAPVQARLCVRPLPVDGRPIVGWLPGFDNAYLVVGHSGVTLAPLLGALAAAEVTSGAQPALDPYRITRFS